MTNITKTSSVTYGNASTYFSGSARLSYSHSRFGNVAIYGNPDFMSATIKNAIANNDFMATLYPNYTASPISGNIQAVWLCDNEPGIVEVLVSSTAITHSDLSSSTFTTYDSGTLSPTALTNSTRESDLRINCTLDYYSYEMAMIAIQSITFAFSFNRYDFTATAGTGIASASVINGTSTSDAYQTSHGFYGDSIVFSATVQDGYEFDGWYNGSTKVSSDLMYGVDASRDVSLTAKTQRTVSDLVVTSTYKGTTTTVKTYTDGTETAIGTYKGENVISITDGETKTIAYDSAHCYFEDDITFDDKKLNLKGKAIDSNIVITAYFQ